jgi:hypothetical protein
VTPLMVRPAILTRVTLPVRLNPKFRPEPGRVSHRRNGSSVWHLLYEAAATGEDIDVDTSVAAAAAVVPAMNPRRPRGRACQVRDVFAFFPQHRRLGILTHKPFHVT